MNVKALIYIFVGGGAGSVLRYLLQLLIATRSAAAGGFPWATWAANVTGCFLIGLFYGWSEQGSWSAETRLLLTTGLCGGFTTFSTFSNESLTLARQGEYLLCGLYLLASLTAGVAAAWAGSRLIHT